MIRGCLALPPTMIIELVSWAVGHFFVQVAGGGTGYLRLWFAALEGINARKEAFLFVNDIEGQSEECLLIRARGI